MDELNNYRAICNVLLRHVTSPQTLLAIADDIFPLVSNQCNHSSAPSHESRVRVALGNAEVLDFLRNGQKINAIKALRAVTLCGLKEAKDAIEDSRVNAHYVTQF